MTHKSSPGVAEESLWIQADPGMLLTLPFTSCGTGCLSSLSLSRPSVVGAYLCRICFSLTALSEVPVTMLPLSSAQ